VTVGRLILWLLVISAIVFAVQGGEYSTRDLWKQRRHKLALIAETDSLARVVDSLRRESRLIQTDRATQERIAREQFGMVKGDNEILYRLGTPQDTTSRQ
jgi:cell division protein FtsB